MVYIMKLYQYGCSVSLGEEATICYGQLLAEQYDFEFVQLSESSASNPYIALKFCETYTRITSEDFIIFGWSHPNRQSWYNNMAGKWEHMNYVQGKKHGSALVNSCKDYLVNQYEKDGYIERLHSWYPRHIVEMTCKVNNLRYIHVDCVPGMVSKLGVTGGNKNAKSKYIADHLHPNDNGHRYIFELLKDEINLFL